MTIKQITAAIREMGLSCVWISETKEFRINFKNGTEETSCYADREDAIGTARAFCQHKPVAVVEQAPVQTAAAAPVTLRVMMENNAGHVVLAGHVLCKSAILFLAKPLVGRPHTWFNSLEQAESYTRGE